MMGFNFGSKSPSRSEDEHVPDQRGVQRRHGKVGIYVHIAIIGRIFVSFTALMEL